MKAVIEMYSTEEIQSLIDQIQDPERKLYFIDSFTKSANDHTEKMLRLQHDKSKLTTDDSADEIVFTIRLPKTSTPPLLESDTEALTPDRVLPTY